MLNVTARHLEEIVKRLASLESKVFFGLNDASSWEIIDKAIYRDDDRPMEKIAADTERFFKFDFLTNGGESFNTSKSFIVSEGGWIRILFVEGDNSLDCIHVSVDAFRSTVQAFLDWVSLGGKQS